MIIASKHFPRIITGAVLVSVLGTALYLSGPYLFGLLLLFTLVGLWEFYAMFWPLKANIGGRILGLALGGLLITAAWMRPEMVVMTLALSTLILACMFLFCWSHDDKYRFTRVAVHIVVVVFVSAVQHYIKITRIYTILFNSCYLNLITCQRHSCKCF